MTAVLQIEKLFATLLCIGVGVLVKDCFVRSRFASATLILIVITTATLRIPQPFRTTTQLFFIQELIISTTLFEILVCR